MELNKLESGIKVGTQVTINPSSNVIYESYDETKIPYKLLLTYTQV